MNDPTASKINTLNESTPLPRITSMNLLKGSNILLIEHNGAEYRLRLTSNQKLILTK